MTQQIKFPSFELEEEVPFKSITRTLDSVVDNLNSKKYNFNPAYQRGDVWKPNLKMQLIISILKGIPINTIHVVQDEHGVFNILDGKQRLTAIKEFCKEEFSITVLIDNEDKKIKYKDLDSFKLKKTFDETEIRIISWEQCPLKSQKRIFQQVNNNVALNTNEIIYCGNFLTKRFLDAICNKSFYLLEDYFTTDIFKNKRFAKTRFLHDTVNYSFGPYLEQDFSPGHIHSRKNITKSAKRIEEILEESGVDSNTSEEAILKKSSYELKNIDKNIKLLRNSCEWISSALKVSNNLPKKIHKNILTEIISFLVSKQQQEFLTEEYLSGKLNILHSFIFNWISFKEADGKENYAKKGKEDHGQSTTEKSKIRKNFEIMEGIWKEVGFIDKIRKKKEPTDSEKLITTLASDGVCPISGDILTEHNSQIDHIIPYSQNSDLKVISKVANRQKSDLTLEKINNTKNYIIDNGEQEELFNH